MNSNKQTEPQIANKCLKFNVHSVLDCNLKQFPNQYAFFSLFWYLEYRHGVITKTDYVAFHDAVSLNLHEENNIKKKACVEVEEMCLTMWQIGSLWKQTDGARCTYQV